MIEAPWMESLRSQWQSSPWLRGGLGLVLVLLWSEGLLRVGDLADEERRAATEWAVKGAREAVAGDRALWADREMQAQAALKSWEERLWPAQERGLVEAQAQDALRALATRAGLNIRELRVVQAELTGPSAHPAVRLRVTLDHTRAGTLALLSQLAEERPQLVLDRWTLRLATQPPQLELELRALMSLQEGGR